MTATEVDLCLLYRSDKQGNLDYISCLQVEGTITLGSRKFCEDEEKASKSFKSTGQNYIKDGSTSKFNGQNIRRRGKEILIHQQTYIDSMPGTPITQDKASFMCHRGQAVSIRTCIRPDATFAVNQLTQTKPTDACGSDFERLERIFKRLKDKKYELRYGNVDLDTAEVHVFSDASFANNKDLSS